MHSFDETLVSAVINCLIFGMLCGLKKDSVHLCSIHTHSAEATLVAPSSATAKAKPCLQTTTSLFTHKEFENTGC